MIFSNRDRVGYMVRRDGIFSWSDADNAQFFLGPGLSYGRHQKQISEQYEEWKRSIGVDCDEDVMYEVAANGNKVYVHETIRINSFQIFNMVYDYRDKCVWIELQPDIWAPCFCRDFAIFVRTNMNKLYDEAYDSAMGISDDIDKL